MGKKISLNEKIYIKNTNLNLKDVADSLNGNKAMGSIVVDNITCKNKFNKNTITRGYRLVSSGLYKDSLYFVSDFIEVVPNATYTVNYEMTVYTRMLFYNTDKSIIKINETEATFTTPSNAKYVKIGQLLTELDNVQLEPGPVTTDYTEHKEFEKDKDSGIITIVEGLIEVRRVDKLCMLTIYGDYTTEIANNSSIEIGVIPEGYRPYRALINPIIIRNESYTEIENTVVSLNTEGQIKIRQKSGSAVSPTQLFATLMYFTDEPI